MILVIIGLIGLWLGTRWIMDGAIGIANRFNLAHSFVGVAILAVGTDLPEAFVSINAALLHLKGIESSGIIVGNAIGSSIAQITFILGVAGLYLRFTLSKRDLIRDGAALFSSIILLFLFGLDGVVTRTEGGVLLMVYLIYYFILLKGKNNNQTEGQSSEKVIPALVLATLLFSGFTVLIFSAHLVVDNSMELAEKWGVAQSFVGIVIIGVGTSLPELAVSVGAALRKSAGMSVGNIIGSNIFDGFIPVGLGGLISTTNMESNILNFDLPFLFSTTLLTMIFLATKRGISVFEGIIFIVVFAFYIATKLYFLEG